MRQTTNYQLPSWDSDDRILRTDFNELTEKVDTALKANADSVTSLSTQVAQKGNCRIYTTVYTGSGTCGQSNPRTMTFPFHPSLLHIMSKNDGISFLVAYDSTIAYAVANANNWVRFTWGWTQVSWYSDSPDIQMNKSGEEYLVTVLG